MFRLKNKRKTLLVLDRNKLGVLDNPWHGCMRAHTTFPQEPRLHVSA